jgi:hypothetical protein
MAINISSDFKKASTSIPYLLKDADLRGGFRVVADTTERDAIHSFAKVNGMVVFSIADASYYRWNSDLTTPAWENWDLSGQVTAGTGITKNATTGALEADTSHLDTLYAPVNHNHTFDSLGNVTIDTVADGELVKWDSASSQWINTTLAEAGIAPENHGHDWAAISNVPQVTAMPGVTIASTDPGSTDGVDGDIWFVVPA